MHRFRTLGEISSTTGIELAPHLIVRIQRVKPRDYGARKVTEVIELSLVLEVSMSDYCS